MNKLVTVYRKFCVAALAAAGVITASVADGKVTLAEAVAIGLALIGAGGVAAVANKPA